MGSANSKKLAAKCSFLSKDEQLIVSNSFKIASRNSEKIKEDELIKLWGSQIDVRLLQFLNNYLFGIADKKQSTVELERFAELFVFCTRGTIDEKIRVLMMSLGKSEFENSVPYSEIREYVESVVSSYMKIQKMCKTLQFKGWFSKGCFISTQNIQRLAECLTYDLPQEEILTKKSLEIWLQSSTLLSQLLLSVSMYLFNISHKEKGTFNNDKTGQVLPEDQIHINEKDTERSLIPLCKGLELIPSYPSILDFNQIVFINAHLPQQYQLEWRFLFSSEIHGESFSTLIGRIVNQGPTVLIVEDTAGYTFGGFAPANWELYPKFYGDDSSFLFTVCPHMRIFHSSGYNQNFQYLNLHQQTLPNGLAMGGQHKYCGLWLDSEYGKGETSPSCTTYRNYQQMSQSKQFRYRHLEVWSLSQPPATPQEKGERAGNSILDDNVESKAILKMSGRQMHSEGLRETLND